MERGRGRVLPPHCRYGLLEEAELRPGYVDCKEWLGREAADGEALGTKNRAWMVRLC